MNAQLRPVDLEDEEEESLVEEVGGQLPFILQKLRPKHKQALALIAQGYSYVDTGKMVGYTPQYIGMLLRQPVCIEFVRTINEVVAQQLEVQFGLAAATITSAMQNGNVGEQLKAVRLHLEVTKRIGSGREVPISPQSSDERLGSLAHRLIDLLQGAQNGTQGNASLQGFPVIRGEQVSDEGQGRLPLTIENGQSGEEPRERE